ncbi:glycoside hydrolase superfamily [Amylostereum chailletii]|nr:glycoside hydrolase superfamily [Amylostereum chailletii]
MFIGAAASLVRCGPLLPRAPSGDKTVIVQMFEWSWDSIASECTNFLGPAGYGFVQGAQWWTDYQPVSYILTSKRGNRDQYQKMISTCHAAGVKVIADTIFNHMSGSDSGTGVAGSTYTHYVYPGIYQNQDFHHCGLESGDDIVNYDNAVEVQTCELVNLADLATDTEYVRSRLAEYANDLLSLGVDGLRLDAAKHIPTGDIQNILSRLNGTPYITQEVIFGSGEPITPAMYTQNGDVQEFRYTSKLQDAFLNSGISSLQNLDNQGWISGSQANVFVANHDTERGGSSLNSNSPSNTYVLATIFSLAYTYGTPTVLSSYTFQSSDDGSPNGGMPSLSVMSLARPHYSMFVKALERALAPAVATAGLTRRLHRRLCQHRWTAFSGMVGFRNAVGSAALTNWVSPSSNKIAFGRGTAGFVAINNEDSQWSATFKTSLPDGTYCDVVHEAAVTGSCTGTTYTVSSGSFSATIAARDALALHTK